MTQVLSSDALAAENERLLDRHAPDEPMVTLSLTDDIYLRSYNWARLALGIPLPPLERSLLLAHRGVAPTYAIGWEHLLVAHLRHAVGDADASARAVAH